MLYTQNSRITKDFIQKNYKVRNQIHERIIKLKSQSKWIVRIFTLTGIIFGFIFAFTGHPIGGTNAENIPSAYEVTYHPEANVSYTLNGNENFTGGLITITDGTETYTIMDRNLGATSTGVDSSDSYGYYFQWGNNYGFSSDPNASITTSSEQVDASGYGPGHYYSSSTWITSNPWDSSENNNLWGGVSGTYEAMQGPCPEGYHVPSSGEWLGLSTMLGYPSNDSQAINSLRNKLYLPFAGRRNWNSAGIGNQGSNAYYWSSTAYSADNAYSLSFSSYGLYPHDGSNRSHGFSVRCFKDSPYSASSEEECPEGQHLATGDVCVTSDLDIILQATATAANQTLKINKYFANEYTVDRGDGTTPTILGSDTAHTYASAGTYNIILSTAANRWTFRSVSKPLVPKDGTTMTGVKIIYMPSLEDGFGASATNPGDYFFSYFNYKGNLTSLPERSFDTSKITTVGNNFFYYFNSYGSLTSLPDNSFDTSNITTVGNNFFAYFNYNGNLTSLPEGSFRFSTGLTTVEDFFFSHFTQSSTALTSLPEGSFDTSHITTVGDNFFAYFNTQGSLTSLPELSFDTSHITTVGDKFFSYFTLSSTALTSLPEGSFRFSTGLTTVGDNFFSHFTQSSTALTSLPEGSFDTSNITIAGNNFFSYFNYNGVLTSLPENSFDTSKITTVGTHFFSYFNYNGKLTSLPENSFDISNISGTVGTHFFAYFNQEGSLTSLPDSFKLNSAAYNKSNGYANAFNSPNHTLNKNVSDLVSGVVAPNGDRDTFSDNQQGRCGVTGNWLVTTADACSITYDYNGGTAATITKKYTADITGVVAGSSIAEPSKIGYDFDGWYTEPIGGTEITTVSFPLRDGETLYAHWFCPEGTHEEGDLCVANEQLTGCLLTGEIPANSNYNIENVTGTWNSGTNSWNVSACSWTCNTGYIESLNGQSCEKQNIATFNTSGVVTNGTITKSCTIHDNNIQSCDVTAPNLTGYVILGRSTNPSDNTPDYEIGETIPLMGDMTYYAITSPAIEFTGITPVDNSAQNENYFTSQIDITTSNLSGFSSVLDENATSLYDDSLVLMYNFDNVESLGESSTIVKDLSKYGNDGIVYGATWTGNGVHGGAYSFDGVDDYIDLPDYDVNDSLKTNGTISVRAKRNKKNGVIIGSYNSLVIGITETTIIGTSEPNTHPITASLINYNDQGWNHMVVTSNSGIISYYINGKKLNNNPGSTNYWWRTTGSTTIGKRVYSSPYPFSGQIDEIRVYNRALTSGEIETLYRSNLSKTALNKWTYTIGFTGLAGGIHTYGGIMSDTSGSTGVSRTINICGAGYHAEDGQTCKKSNVQVTFVANPSTFPDGGFSGGATSKTLEYFFATGGYYAAKTEEIQIPQKPHEYDSNGNLLTGWMFEGWYLDTGYSAASRWTGLSADTPYTGITLYARYLPFKDKTITMDGVTFTIMDRNMGALDYSSGYSYGNNNEQSNTDRIGLYYQRGNNFGFPNNGILENTLSGVLVENFTNKTRGPGNYYFNGSFVKKSQAPYAWNSGAIAYENLWGGSSSSNPDLDRQGPCPEGYHVPYTTERKASKDTFDKRTLTGAGSTYCNSLDNSATQYCMPAALGLPFAGRRQMNSLIAGQRAYGYYMSSVGFTTDGTLSLYFDKNILGHNSGDPRSYGFSIRCFKDTTGVTLSYDSKGGTAIASSTERRWFAKSTAPTNPTRTGSTFAGWYRDTGYTDEFIFSGDTYISEDTTLYAKWTCKAGYEMDGNGDCKKSNVQVTFVANPSTFSDGRFSGEITSKTLEYFFATGGYYAAVTEEIQIPQKPHERDSSGNLLTGWMFEGRYLDTGYSAASRWTGLSANTTYTGITLYARYLPFKDKTVTRDGITFTIMDRNLGALDYSSGYSYQNEQSNNDRIGLYYQRGNNFGFPNLTWQNTLSGVLIENLTNKEWGPGNYYFNGTFIHSYTSWNLGATENDNLWGGSSYSNPDIDRQGPCPEGYHVPYTTERRTTKNLFDKRALSEAGSTYCNSIDPTNTGSQYCMPATLGLPFDGRKHYTSASVDLQRKYANYWSSTASSITYANTFYIYSDTFYPKYESRRAYGFSIRCFKDTTGVTLSYDSKGGTAVTSSTKRRWFAKSTAPSNPTRTNSTFAGWYKDTGYTDKFTFSSTTYISENTTLYAKWTCNSGYIESLDGQSCEENILPYTINHYQENTGNNGYTLFESENKTGLSDNLTQATSNTYQGFTAQAFQQQTIQGNDTHVDIYYDRNVYTININLNGGTGPTSFTGKYGDTVVPPEITKSGYSIKKRVPELPETMPIGGFSSKPVRVLTDGSISISVNPNKNTLDLSIRGTSNSSRELTGAFTNDYFTISDTKGEENGYHATLSIGDLVGNDNVNHIIPASNAQVKTDGIVRLSGAPSSEVGLTTTMTNWRTATGQVTYFTRGDIVIDDECKPGEYGINLDLKITVPSYTIPDNYHGTITYTLYED